MSDAESKTSSSESEMMTMFQCRKCAKRFHSDDLEAHREFHRQERRDKNSNKRSRTASPSRSEGTIFTTVKEPDTISKTRPRRKMTDPEGKTPKKARRIRSTKTFNTNTSNANKGRKFKGN